MKSCQNCAWYCHTDGKCYGGTDISGRGAEYVRERALACRVWTSDGLSDEERASLYEDALVTMELEPCSI